MTTPRRIALGVALGLLVLLAWQQNWLRWVPVPVPGPVAIEQAVIVHETGVGKPLTPEQTRIYAGATALGAWVIDKDTLGPGKQPSPKLKPYLDATKDKTLPVLVLRYAGGRIEAEPLPDTLEKLKERIGK